MAKKITSIHDFLEQTKDMTPAEAGKEIYWLTEKEIKEILSQKPEKKKEETNPKDLGPVKGKESNEKTTSVLPWAVAKQESEALKYFNTNNEVNHLQVITQVQELRKQKQIQYKETSPGTYEIIFNLPWIKLKWYMPQDSNLDDSSWSPTYWDGNSFNSWATTKQKLRSDEWKKYLKDKEKKENKNLLNKNDFVTLWKALYPSWTEEEQILAIMIATWFYGWMWLSDKTSDYQLAVECSRLSDDREFDELGNVTNECSIIYTGTL